MHHLTRVARASVVIAPLVLVGLVLAAMRLASPGTPAARSGTAHGPCDVLGTYLIAPGALPAGAPGAVPTAMPPPSGPSPTGPEPAYPFWALRGELRLTAYTTCGASTAGAFSVRRVAARPDEQPSGSGGGPGGPRAFPCRTPCWPPTGVAAATGTFVQDPTHHGDPLYVRVSATITSTRPGPMIGLACSMRTGCPPVPVITSTLRMAAITGYLQLTTMPPGGRMLTLSFLPPPDPASGPGPQPLNLVGWRGGGAPAPQATPSSGGGAVYAGTAVVASTAVSSSPPSGPPPTVGPTATTVPASGTVTLHLSDRLATITLRVGATLIIDPGPSFTLGNLTADPAILALRGHTGAGLPILRAVGPGVTPLSATASPRCLQAHPACAVPSLLLSYTVRVVSGG